MSLTPKQRAEFETLSKPLIKWLNDNMHPHAFITVANDGAQLLEGVIGFPCDEFIKD